MTGWPDPSLSRRDLLRLAGALVVSAAVPALLDQALAQGGQPVAQDQMQPGDLVTYYSDASHVAIYIGDGMMVHASTYGTPVRVAPVDNAPIFNIRRY